MTGVWAGQAVVWGSGTVSRPLTCGALDHDHLYAAHSYLLISPPRTPRRPILCAEIGDCGRRSLGRARWPQIPGSMRPVLVVVGGVLLKDHAQVP